MNVPSFFAVYQRRVDDVLQHLVPAGAGAIEQAMAYSLHAPSKRVRPVLTMLAAEICGGQVSHAVAAGAAIELVHTSSLILDDLPSMDNAALRRGRAANHIVFGESIAILAAFGLLNLAFGTLARSYEPPLSTRLSGLLSDAVGCDGLIAGQRVRDRRRHDGQRPRRVDCGAVCVCQEPGPRLSNRRRSAGRRRQSC
jgi:geranylgeranyl diphosphate synthase type II